MTPRRREGPRRWPNSYYYFDARIGFKPNIKRLRYSLKTKDPVKAEFLWKREWRRQWEKYYGVGKGSIPGGPLPLEQLSEEYVAWLRDIKRIKEWKTVEQRLRKIRKVWPDVDAQDIGASHFAALDAWLRSNGRSTATINHYIKVVKALYNYAIHKKYLTDNPANEVRPYVVDEKRRAYSPDEMTRILEAATRIEREARPQDDIQRQARRLVLLLYYTAMRLGEILMLRWDNIQGDLIRLERTETKQRREKVIPIGPEVRAVIDELAAERRNDYVLPLRRRSGNMVAAWADNPIRKIREYSGIQDFIFHNLRHTASTLMISGALGRGASLADVMKVLGHSKLDTTLKYVHADQAQMKKAMDSIPPIGYNIRREKEGKRKLGRQSMGKKASREKPTI